MPDEPQKIPVVSVVANAAISVMRQLSQQTGHSLTFSVALQRDGQFACSLQIGDEVQVAGGKLDFGNIIAAPASMVDPLTKRNGLRIAKPES